MDKTGDENQSKTQKNKKKIEKALKVKGNDTGRFRYGSSRVPVLKIIYKLFKNYLKII